MAILKFAKPDALLFIEFAGCCVQSGYTCSINTRVVRGSK
jgi:hypothetical protein